MGGVIVGHISTAHPIGWAAATAEYLTAMRAAGRAKGTIRLHRHYLGQLAEQLRSPWSASTRQLLAFLAVEHWSAETRKSARQVVAGFYRWGHGSGYIDHNPALNLPAVRVPPGVPRPTPEYLVAKLTRDDTRLGHMARLAAFCGLRAGEIARVNGRDYVDGQLLVHGKGGKLRAVPVVDRQLDVWLRGLGDRWAFPNGYGGHLSSGHVSKLLSRAMPPGWTAHTLRHRMATVGYAHTRDLLAVGAVLGHSRPETTQRYVRQPDDALRAVVAAAGPAV